MQRCVLTLSKVRKRMDMMSKLIDIQVRDDIFPATSVMALFVEESRKTEIHISCHDDVNGVLSGVFFDLSFSGCPSAEDLAELHEFFETVGVSTDDAQDVTKRIITAVVDGYARADVEGEAA